MMGRIFRRLGLTVLLLVIAAGAVVAVIYFSPSSSTTTSTSSDDHKLQYYTCGMHPWVLLPHPGDCPICHMPLTPIDPDKFTGQLTIDPVVVQNIGVRIAPVTRGPLTNTIRTVGTVDYDEETVRDVNTKVSGWIEKLHVNFLGAPVKAGEPLFDLYSPQLYAAQQELLLTPPAPGSNATGTDLLQAARTKLQFFDITDDQIDQLLRSGKPAKTMTILSPYSGVVIEKHANEGMKVDPGMRVYRIADLSKVWVMVTLYEYQLPYVQAGQEATMTLPYIPGQTFTGKVLYIYPYLDSKLRQVNVRLEFENPHGVLKPGMYANVELHSELAAERTLAPRSAVIDTGLRQVAFVSLGDGKFEPRDVKLGVETEDTSGGGGQVEVLDGLKPGEMVVTSGQFLLDSEAKMREALAKMIRGTPAAEQKAVATVQGASALTSLPDAAAEHINAILRDYMTIGDHLSRDSIEDLAAPARAIAQTSDALVNVAIPDQPDFWRRHDEVATIGGKAHELLSASDLAVARLAFADLSIALDKLLHATGVPPSFGQPVQQLHCPMYRTKQGGNVWLQTADEVHNPFFGSKMLGCFDQRHILPVTGQSQDTPTTQSATQTP